MSITRRSFVAGTAAHVAAAADRRPNILLVMTDQQTIRAMSCAGNPYVRTPALDALAAAGVRFERSYCTSPVCGPARSSIVTGRMTHETGVVHHGAIRESIPTIGQLLASAGYHTAWSGKWHLPEMYPAFKAPWSKLEATHKTRGFEVLDMEGDPERMSFFGDFADPSAVDAAAEFLRRRHDKPFFLGVSLHNPHDICHHIIDKLPDYHPGKSDEAVRDPAKLPPLPSNFARHVDEPEFITECRKRTRFGAEVSATLDWTTERWRQYLYVYYRMTERVSAEVGRLLQALDETGMRRNTAILFTSDHGEGMAAHQWVVKLMLFEEVVSVPLILSYPTLVKGRGVNSTHLASGVDIAPTICRLAGIDPPQQSLGMDLVEIAQGKNRGRDAVVVQLAPDMQKPAMQGRMIRTNRFKYVVFSEGAQREMFFDLKHDPGETRNLTGDASSNCEIVRHKEQLTRWLESTRDSFPL